MIVKNKYHTHVLPRLDSIEEWVAEGIDEKEIAQRLGILSRTLERYKKEHDELFFAICKGRERIINKVEKALLKKAIGYTYIEKKVVDKGDKREETITHKEVPPDLSAISFLLKNLCPEKWADKPISQKETEGGGVVILPDILKEEE